MKPLSIVLNILAIISLVFGTVFTYLPLDTLAFLPIGIALVLALAAFFVRKEGLRKLSKVLLAISLLLAVIVAGKVLFIKDTVAHDTSFEQKKEQSEQESIQELEELEEVE